MKRWTRLGPTALCLLQVLGCRSSETQSSSSSHFVECRLDAQCLALDEAAGCDGEHCVDMRGERLLVEDSADVGTTSGVDDGCDPTAPLEKPLELAEIMLVAEAEDGTLYVVDNDDGEFRAFRSVGQRLVPHDVGGFGVSSDSVTLTASSEDGDFTLWFAPEDNPTEAMWLEGEVEDARPDPGGSMPTGGTPLAVRGESALDGVELSPAVSAMVVEYHAYSDAGHELVVVRPERYFENQNMRLFLASPGDDTLVERRVTEALRFGDDRATFSFMLDGAQAEASFWLGFNNQLDPVQGAGLLLGADEVWLTRTDETLDALQTSRFVCFDRPPNGWRPTDELPPAGAGAPMTDAGADAATAAPSPEDARTDVELVGTYDYGFEFSGFRPCGAEAWWWTNFEDAAQDAHQALEASGCEAAGTCSFFVRGTGDLSELLPGGFGHLSSYDREVTFRELDQLVPLGFDSQLDPCPDPEQLTILGHVVAGDGQTIDDATSYITVVTFEEWSGEVPNDAALDFSSETSSGYFVIRVPPQRWGVLASFGTCSSAPLEEAMGEAGDVVNVELTVNCSQ